MSDFPPRPAPDQVRVLTLNDDEALIHYAQPIVAELHANMVRVNADYSAAPFNSDTDREQGRRLPSRAREEVSRLLTSSATSGPRRTRSPGGGAGAVSVRLHHGDPQGATPKGEVVADILVGITERRA